MSTVMSPRSSQASPTNQRSLFRNSNEDRKKRESVTLLKMVEVTAEYLEKMEETSRFFGEKISIGNENENMFHVTSSPKKGSESEDNGENMEEDEPRYSNSKPNRGVGIVVPRFQPNEIQLETTIGMGEFGVVLKVGMVSLNPVLNRKNGPQEQHSVDEGEETIVFQHPSKKKISTIDSGIAPIETTRSQSIHNNNSDNNSSSSNGLALWLSLEKKRNHADHIETNRILREELAKTCVGRKLLDGSTSTASTDLIGNSSSSLSSQAVTIELELAQVSSSDVPTNSLLVIKQIRKDLYPKRRIEAAKDLAREAKLLARLQQLYFLQGQSSEQQDPYYRHNKYNNSNTAHRNNHPNLITLRGIVADPGSPDFGILLDRLHLTLAELATSWGKRQEIILETLASSSSGKHGASSPLPLTDQLLGAFVEVTQKVGGWFHKNGEDHEDNESEHGKRSATPPQPQTASEEVSRSLSDAAAATSKTTIASPEALLLLGERILALWDVSEGMGHLHDHKILYRDLKTENVGRTVCSRTASSQSPAAQPQSQSPSPNLDHQEQQRMQIFDFGLAKECKPSDRISESPNTSTATLTFSEDCQTDSGDASSFYDNYKMTGLTGTMRIMAPEVIQCKPYGLPADVYSFGICMWEVFTGTKCNFLSAAEICDTKHVVRPELPVVFDTQEGSVGMPKKLQKLMQKCWHEDPKRRPGFPEISKTLRSILADLVRQSTHPKSQSHLQPQQDYRHEESILSSPYRSKGPDGRKSLVSSPFRSCVNSNGNSGGGGGGGLVGGFWSKIVKTQKRQQQQQQRQAQQKRQQQYQTMADSPNDSTTATTSPSSDQAEFWSRLEMIRASGLLDN